MLVLGNPKTLQMATEKIVIYFISKVPKDYKQQCLNYLAIKLRNVQSVVDERINSSPHASVLALVSTSPQEYFVQECLSVVR